MRREPAKWALIGAHVSTAGGIWRAPDRAVEIGANVAQVFVKNNLQWTGGPLGEVAVRSFQDKCSAAGLVSVGAHACYLINLASSDSCLWEKSIQAMVDELRRCRRLGISPLVVHPGSHSGEGLDWGVRRISAALDRIVCESGTETAIALEVTAGQGNQVGFRFEHLRDVLGSMRHSANLRVCLDTCHLFAAGYDIADSEGYQETMQDFHRLVGLNRLAVLHLNDSKRELGSRVDRHENIGRGRIGLSGFAFIMNDPRLTGIPKILETPKGRRGYWDRRNLGVLRRLLASPGRR